MATGAGHHSLPVMLGERVIYQDAYAQGQAVTEAEPFGKASQEIREVYMYVSSLSGIAYCPQRCRQCRDPESRLTRLQIGMATRIQVGMATIRHVAF